MKISDGTPLEGGKDKTDPEDRTNGGTKNKKELKHIDEQVVVDSVLLPQASSDLLKIPSGCV